MEGFTLLRNAVVPIRFSVTERQLLYDQAKSVGLSLSSFVRRAALKRRMPPPPVAEINREAYRDLCRIGNNLNQVTRAVHEQRLNVVDSSTLALLIELRRLVKEIGMKVYGVVDDSETN